MIDWWQAFLLALIQGLTEFLPISSSAHLILPSDILDWDDQGLAFDVAVHLGSLMAVIWYFRQKVGSLVVGGMQSLGGNWTESGRLAWMLVLATIPAALVGLILGDFIEENLRSARVIAATTLMGALLLALADKTQHRDRGLEDLTWLFVLIIGLAQATALIPGTSRSGITMTMALLLGLRRTSAAEFSFLMAIPVILLSAMWKSLDLFAMQQFPRDTLLIGISVSAISAYLCIKYFLKLIERVGFMPFVIYRLLLGAILLVLVV